MASMDIDDEEDQEERPTDFSGIKEELAGKKQIEKIQEIASNDPEILAQMMEQWLQEGGE